MRTLTENELDAMTADELWILWKSKADKFTLEAWEERARERLRIFVDNKYQPLFSQGVSLHNAASRDSFQEINKDGLRAWREHIHLPKDHVLLGVYYGLNEHKWQLIIDTNRVCPYRSYSEQLIHQASYSIQIDDGKICVSDLKIIKPKSSSKWEEQFFEEYCQVEDQWQPGIASCNTRALTIPNNLRLLPHASPDDISQIQEELNTIVYRWASIIAQRRAEALSDLVAITEDTDHNEL